MLCNFIINSLNLVDGLIETDHIELISLTIVLRRLYLLGHYKYNNHYNTSIKLILLKGIYNYYNE